MDLATIQRTWPGRLLWLLLLIALPWAGACSTTDAAQKKTTLNPGQTELRIASFKIQGTKRFSESTIKDGLVTTEDPGWRAAMPWMPLIGAEHQYFNSLDWERDLERIQIFYAMHGYFNARVVNKSIVQSQEKDEVRISITISEGEPTMLTEMDIEGLEPLADELREEIVKDLALEVGEVFTQEKYQQTRRALATRLKRRSFAYAQTTGRATIDPETDSARVQFFLDPGPHASFGEVYIIGNDQIETRFIEDALTIKPGEDYSAHQLDLLQADIYDMGVFSLVSVLPAHEASQELLEQAGIDPASVQLEQEEGQPSALQQESDDSLSAGARQMSEGDRPSEDEIQVQDPDADDEDDDDMMGAMGISDLLAEAQSMAEARTELDQSVPIIVRVKEARLWNVEVGAGVSVGTNRSDIHGLANWSSQNFLGGLRKLEHFNTAGYAWAANDSGYNLATPLWFGGKSEAANQGVFLESRLQFRQPQFLEKKTIFKSGVSLKRNIEVGYTVWNPAGMIGVERKFWRHLNLELNYRLSYFSYQDVGQALLTTPELGVEYAPDYLLEYLEQRATLDFRDDPFNPTSGFLSSLTFQEAGSYVAGGDFDFLKVAWANQAYLPFSLLTDWVLAGRFRVGAIYNTETTQRDESGRSTTRAVPIESRFYAGGAGSLRGLGRNNLSYFRVGSYDPSNPADIKKVEVIPVGGVTVLEASIEPRFQLMENLAGVGPLWGVLFYDVATVLDKQLYFNTSAGSVLAGDSATVKDLRDSLVSGLGGGMFWLTPVGPVRADFAVTLNDLSNDPRFRICGPFSRVQDGASQSGQTSCDYMPEARDPIVQQLNLNYSFFIGIGHSF